MSTYAVHRRGRIALATLALPCLALLAAFAVFAFPASATTRSMNGRIAFAAHSQVFTVNPNGTGLRQLTQGPLTLPDAGIAWSPDGRDLLFVLFAGGQGDQIVESRANGSGVVSVSPRCTGGPCGNNDPVVSPNGTRIAFERRWAAGGSYSSAIFTMNRDGTDLTQLTQTADAPTSSVDSHPTWSPDGRKIAFVRTNTTATPSGESAIELMNADGGNLQRLTPFQIDAGNPHWSPNGKRILFNTFALPFSGRRPVTEESANLYIMRPDGSHRMALTHYTGGAIQAFVQDWSPDGTDILFNRVTYSDTNSSASHGHFYIMNLRTKQTRLLATSGPTNAIQRAAWGRSASLDRQLGP